MGSHDIDLAINNMTGEQFGLKMQEYLELPGNADKYVIEHEKAGKDDKNKAKRIAPGLHKIEANPEKSKNLETATTKIMGIDLDLVNLRKETYNDTSRNPIMEFGTAEEDAMRRDANVYMYKILFLYLGRYSTLFHSSRHNNLPRNRTLLTHTPKNPPSVKQLQRRRNLRNSTPIHNTDPIIPNNSLESMRNTQQCATLESLRHSLLDFQVGLKVD